MQAATLENQADKVQKDAWCEAFLCSSRGCRERLTKDMSLETLNSEIYEEVLHQLIFSVWWSSDMCSCLLKFQEPDPSEQPQSREKDCFQSTVQRKIIMFYHALVLMVGGILFPCGSRKTYPITTCLSPLQEVVQTTEVPKEDLQELKTEDSMRKWRF